MAQSLASRGAVHRRPPWSTACAQARCWSKHLRWQDHENIGQMCRWFPRGEGPLANLHWVLTIVPKSVGTPSSATCASHNRLPLPLGCHGFCMENSYRPNGHQPILVRPKETDSNLPIFAPFTALFAWDAPTHIFIFSLFIFFSFIFQQHALADSLFAYL
jgi:hypothetical protein